MLLPSCARLRSRCPPMATPENRGKPRGSRTSGAAHVVPFLLCVEGRDEPAAPRVTFCHEQLQQNYSITSSARASSEGGTVRSSAFALLRLIASSSLVACSTGRSLGLAPCSILSMYSATRTNPHRASWP